VGGGVGWGMGGGVGSGIGGGVGSGTIAGPGISDLRLISWQYPAYPRAKTSGIRANGR
jgi:hypothetical protein